MAPPDAWEAPQTGRRATRLSHGSGLTSTSFSDAADEKSELYDDGCETPTELDQRSSRGSWKFWKRLGCRSHVLRAAFAAACIGSLMLTARNVLLDDAPTLEPPRRHALPIPAPVVKAADHPRQAAPTASPSSTAVLECFQVYQPVLTPYGPVDDTVQNDGKSGTTTLAASAQSESCTVLLMERVFAFSYGLPFVGDYTPPSCTFNQVIMNLTVTSRGRQYDRLAIMYLGDSEVFRTSTAEPTTNGIKWTYIKDMTEYLYFWKQPQKLIFDLGNLVDDTLTGTFNTTLTATFFNSKASVTPADLILPVSARKSATNEPSVFLLPDFAAVNSITLPRNVNRAVFTISACGQLDEEFWWGNVLSSDTRTFAASSGLLPGYSPFREVQVYIDGQLAGVQWPFPVIFTGGIVPGLWRPMVGIDAFDLREHEIEITPWLGILCDGNAHTFEIKVAGIADDGGSSGTLTETVGSYWYVTGKIFLWLDDASSITSGGKPTMNFPRPSISLSRSTTTNSTGANQTLTENTSVKRSLSVVSTIKTQRKTFVSTWSQTLSYTNAAQLTEQGAVGTTTLKTSGVDLGSGAAAFKSIYEYPLFSNSSYLIDPSGSGNFTLQANIRRGLTLNINGASVFPTGGLPYLALPGLSSLSAAQLADTTLRTTQDGFAAYLGSPATKTARGYGTTTQHFVFAAVGAGVELYQRHVTAANGTVTYDREELVGRLLGEFNAPARAGSGYREVITVLSPKQAMGRGPGKAKANLVSGGGM